MEGFTFFEPIFWIIFVLAIVFIGVFWVTQLIRTIKGRQEPQVQTMSEEQPVVKEREIIREIVKIRCPYCGNLYDETLDKCPYCGGKKA